MVGAVEVERVVHLFAKDTGFITEVRPDMIVHSNELSTIKTKDAMAISAESLTRRMRNLSKIGENTGQGYHPFDSELFTGGAMSSPSDFLEAVGAVTVGSSSLIGLFAAKKAVQYTNYIHPVTYSPLLYHGRPMIAGVAADRIISTWSSRIHKFVEDGVAGTAEWAGAPGWFNDDMEEKLEGQLSYD